MDFAEGQKNQADVSLADASHRPWPAPETPWIMRMTWLDLVFMHWPVPEKLLRPIIPAELQLDTFDGQAWLGVVPFYMTDVRPRAVPETLASAFPEINVRTYVRSGDRFGVWFFSLDAANRLAVWGARRFYHLPYWLAAMRYSRKDDEVQFESRRLKDSHVEIACRYTSRGEPLQAKPGTLDYFLTERYCLFSANRRGDVFCGEIQHRPWVLQQADAETPINTMADPLGLTLTGPPLLHFSRIQEVVAWPLERLTRY
jgi:uncharacterized protein YqjF (DUF2071 family)